MADAFTAGVEPGGLTSTQEIRILLCYMLDTVGKAIDREDVTNILIAGGMANYFDIEDAIEELIRQQHLIEVDKQIATTVTGAQIGQSLSMRVPYTLRQRSVEAALKLLKRLEVERDNKVDIQKLECKHLCRYRSGTEKLYLVFVKLDYSRLNTVITASAVNNGVDSAVQVVINVSERRGAGLTRKVSGGCGNGYSRKLNKLSRNRICGYSYSNGIKTARYAIGNKLSFLHNDSYRAGHKCLCYLKESLICVTVHTRILIARQMHYQRIVGGSALRLVYFCGGIRVKSVSAKTVYCLRRKGNYAATFNDLSRRLKRITPTVSDYQSFHYSPDFLSFSAVSADASASIRAEIFPFRKESRL